AQREVGHSDARDKDRQPLPASQAFTQEDHSQEDGEQRVDEITKARLQNLPADYGIDKDQPVNRDQSGAGGEQPKTAPVFQDGPNQSPFLTKRDDHHQEENRPENPMAQNNRR